MTKKELEKAIMIDRNKVIDCNIEKNIIFIHLLQREIPDVSNIILKVEEWNKELRQIQEDERQSPGKVYICKETIVRNNIILMIYLMRFKPKNYLSQ